MQSEITELAKNTLIGEFKEPLHAITCDWVSDQVILNPAQVAAESMCGYNTIQTAKIKVLLKLQR